MSTTIFLADDDDDDVKLINESLSEIFSSYEMHRVKDGLECIFALKHFKVPDYIFLDLNMPLKNGIDCLKAIRQIPELSEIPVIIFSATHHMKDIDLSYRFGATYYLVKPPSLPILTSLLKKLFLSLTSPSLTPIAKPDFVIRDKHKASTS